VFVSPDLLVPPPLQRKLLLSFWLLFPVLSLFFVWLPPSKRPLRPVGAPPVATTPLLFWPPKQSFISCSCCRVLLYPLFAWRFGFPHSFKRCTLLLWLITYFAGSSTFTPALPSASPSRLSIFSCIFFLARSFIAPGHALFSLS